MKRTLVIYMAISFAAGLSALAWRLSDAQSDEKSATTTAEKPLALTTDATCHFITGDRAAFTVASEVVLQGQADRFEAIMSWQIEQVVADVARVRAVFNDVVLTQTLVTPEESADSPEGIPFFLNINADCSIASKAYASQWEAATQALVSTLLDNFTFALPKHGESQWQTEAEDGLGQYSAQYSLINQSPLTVQRHKSAHDSGDDIIDFGIDIRLQKSEALAVFDESRPFWWQSIAGSEQVSIETQGEPAVTMTQTFRIERNDHLFAAVPELDWNQTEVITGYDVADEYDLLITTHTSYEEARSAFEDSIYQSSPDYFEAALQLGAWLKAHPEDVDLLVAEIRGNLDDEARPTAFLALELSGSEQARDALSILIYDYSLSKVDQARAASALADLGEPTQEVADLLLERSLHDDTASRVSLLGVGSMVTRIDDTNLHEHVVQALDDRYLLASTISDKALILDTLGNTRDETFVDVLTAELSSDSDITRQHAAKALANMPPEKAQTAIVNRLQDETDARVTTTLVQALVDTGAPMFDIVPVIAEKLKSGNDNQRAVIVQLLAEQNTEEANQMLIAQFKRETNVHIQQLIGRYLPASALR